MGVSCLLSVAGWPPGIDSYLCREAVLIHENIFLFPQLDLNMKKDAFSNVQIYVRQSYL